MNKEWFFYFPFFYPYFNNSNIDELWKHKEILSNNVLGYTKEELMSAFYDIFGKEKVINSKIVGIKFNIVK